MITLIAGTNRKNSFTSKVAHVYRQELDSINIPNLMLDLADINPEVLLAHNYTGRRNAETDLLQQTFFVPASKFIFIAPEYNGSYPGVLKLLIDSLDPSIAIRRKKAAVLGLSSGRGGNMRGLDHLTGVLHYLQVQVMPFLASIPKIEDSFDETGLPGDKLKALIADHAERTILF